MWLGSEIRSLSSTSVGLDLNLNINKQKGVVSSESSCMHLGHKLSFTYLRGKLQSFSAGRDVSSQPLSVQLDRQFTKSRTTRVGRFVSCVGLLHRFFPPSRAGSGFFPSELADEACHFAVHMPQSPRELTRCLLLTHVSVASFRIIVAEYRQSSI
jgi:hypothetical protein